MSTAFAPLGQITGEGAGQASLPIVVDAHPVGDRDAEVVRQRGVAVAHECARVLTTSVERLKALLGLR